MSASGPSGPLVYLYSFVEHYLMNSTCIFEKASVCLMFYIRNHYFYALDCFLNFYPFSFPTFYGRALEI